MFLFRGRFFACRRACSAPAPEHRPRREIVTSVSPALLPCQINILFLQQEKHHIHLSPPRSMPPAQIWPLTKASHSGVFFDNFVHGLPKKFPCKLGPQVCMRPCDLRPSFQSSYELTTRVRNKEGVRARGVGYPPPSGPEGGSGPRLRRGVQADPPGP